MTAPIRLRGVKTHNLRDLDVDIPRGAMTVVTGVSGSGKSSLAFDTVYAEGQRRYVESLSVYARQFLERMPRPPVDVVENVPPAIAVQQANPTRTSRSTVGTATEILDYLRLLYGRIGVTHCVRCEQPVHKDDPSRVADAVLDLPEDTRFYLCAPVRVSKKLAAKDIVAALQQDGFVRLMLDGKPVDLTDVTSKALKAAERVEVVVDRLARKGLARGRLVDSIETAYAHGGGHCRVQTVEGDAQTFSEHFHCAQCDLEAMEPSPNLFSFNSPLGACPECNGFGNVIDLDPELVIRDASKSLGEGAVHPWTLPTHAWVQSRLEDAAAEHGIPLDTPYKRLTPEEQAFVWTGGGRFPGIRKFFARLDRKKYKVHIRVFLARYRRYNPCAVCGGARLRPEALAVTVGGKSIARVTRWRVEQTAEFFVSLTLERQDQETAQRLLDEVQRRLAYLVEVGLGYLTLDRLTRTLSGGEAQRIHLATALGSMLTDTLYVLDEPSIGLHTRDTNRLIRILRSLVDQGNTVLLVEHDTDVIRESDHLIDLGPQAGEQGGQLLFSGSVEELDALGNGSRTARAMQGEGFIPYVERKRPPTHRKLIVEGAREHTLQNIDVTFPLEIFTCVTGVSGSGKSTLVREILFSALDRDMHGSTEPAGLHSGISGIDFIQDVIMIDQSPIGRTPRSNPVTYIQAFSEIRTIFAKTQDAQRRNLKAQAFSFNTGDGRCPKCGGDGAIRVEMHWFADVFIPCDACGGTRYRSTVLEVKYRNATIYDVLQMTVDEAMDFFYDRKALLKKLQVLEDTGLGYLKLGQAAPTLSGGEAQRLKLAAHIAKAKTRDTLFILDEPTVGLHLSDVKVLLDCFDNLIERGNSILCIEHHLDVIKYADWVIDLGPEGGDGGGRVVVEGRPETIMRSTESHTGRCLAAHLQRAPGERALEL